MHTRMRRLAALLLALILLLTGCHLEVPTYMKMLVASMVPTHFSEMEYTRPDVPGLLNALETCTADAPEADFDTLAGEINQCLLMYNEYLTNYNLSNIRYYTDMTDIYWSEEYNYCLDYNSEISAAVDQMLYALADSPHREALESYEYFGPGYFDAYEGESLWDETFTSLMDQEAELLTTYYDLSAQATEAEDQEFYDVYAPQLAQILIDLVILRQEIAAYAGFESFNDFAFDFYFLRDYTPEQEADYLAQVRQELVPIYKDLFYLGMPEINIYSRTEGETFAYVESLAENMGGMVLEAFQLMEECGLYDISYSENKYDASFEVYLPLYNEPYVFLNPSQSDYDFLAFAHEFGHFCNDYASYGTGASVDVAEVFSQGMEYLSLCYAETDNSLEALQMVSSLSVFVEQSAYADFELRLYSMAPGELTVDGVFALFEEVGAEYGFDLWGLDGRQVVTIPHFYIAPCYVFSYVVSNDAALQLYQLEQAETGAGLAKYQENLYPMEITFLAFLESAGLESPFAEGRISDVAATFREALGY